MGRIPRKWDIMNRSKRVTTVDDKYRVFLGRDAIKMSGVKKGDRLLVIPFKGGIALETPSGRKFTESLPGFAFNESKHEATSYLKRMIKSAGS